MNDILHMMEGSSGKGSKGADKFDGQYESNPKHDVKRPGVSPQPTNPEKALHNSVSVSPDSPARISFDSSSGEIVVFRMHSNNIYHGYVKSWENATLQEKNALVNAGCVYSKRKDLKMKYERPKELNEREIDKILSDKNTKILSRVSALLSSIYYSENDKWAGDRLICEFKKLAFSERIFLIDLFETYYDMRQKKYRIDESIILMKDFLKKDLKNIQRIEECLENLKHYRNIY